MDYQRRIQKIQKEGPSQNKMASFFCLVSLLTVKSAFSARVAGLAAFSTGSHYFVVRKVLEELASRGHEVM